MDPFHNRDICMKATKSLFEQRDKPSTFPYYRSERGLNEFDMAGGFVMCDEYFYPSYTNIF